MQSSVQSQPAAPENLDEVELHHSLKVQTVEQGEKVESEAKLGTEPGHERIPEPEQQQDLISQDTKGEKGNYQMDSEQKEQETEEQRTQEPPFTVFSVREKRFIVIIASLAALFSPLSANIYYPALNTLSADLHVSLSKINLTITTYLVCYPDPMPGS